MGTMRIYRILLLIRGCWSVIECLFGWVSATPHLTQANPYLSLSIRAFAEAVVLAVLAGLWFCRPWARFVFTALLVIAVIFFAFWPSHWLAQPPSLALAVIRSMAILNGAIVAISFLPPVADRFRDQT